MTTNHSNRWRPVATLAAALLGGCATTTLGDKMGVEVTAAERRVELHWDALHAWNGAMQQRGAQLVAEYRVDGRGWVREVLGSARPSAERTIAFTLPDTLQNAPQGEVCLYLQLPANQALLPVRRAAGGQDTARFRYAAWEGQVASRSSARVAAADAELLAQQVRDLTGLREKRTAALAQRGWPSAQSCESLQVRRAGTERPPIGVVPTDQQDAVARQVCVHRIDVSRRLFLSRLAGEAPDKRADVFELFGGLAVAAPEGADVLLKLPAGTDGIAAAALQARQQQARVLAEDWRRYSPQVGKDYWPPFGRQNDYLEAIGESKTGNTYLLRQLWGARVGLPEPTAPPMRDRFGALGALMDAYAGCVEDGKRQLRTNAQAWAALQAASPQRDQRLRDYYANECRQEYQRLDALRADEAKATAELARVQGQLAGNPAAPVTPLPTQRVSLNEARCSS